MSTRLPELMNDRRREGDQEPAAKVLVRFIELTAKIKDLEEQREGMKAEVIDILTDEPGYKVPQLLGHELSIQTRRSFTYSQNVTEMENQLKATKKYEEAHHIAVEAKTSLSPVIKKARPATT
jgi:hypothetical protein